MQIEISEATRAHPLWPGSQLQQREQHGILMQEHVAKKAASLRRCDDLQPSERSLLRLLEADLAQFEKDWSFD